MIYVVKVELDVDCGKEDLLYFEDTLNVIYTSKPTYDDLVAVEKLRDKIDKLYLQSLS